jgi:hypothetical protein
MLQEDPTVTFQPEFVWVHVPLYISLFRLYLVVVALFAGIQFARLLWSFGKQKRTRQSQSLAEVSDFWEHSSFKTRSLKTLAKTTLLIAVIVSTWVVSDDLAQITLQKTSSVRAVAGAFADALRMFSAGTIVSTMLFGCAIFCESVIHRQRLGLVRTGNKAQSNTA